MTECTEELALLRSIDAGLKAHHEAIHGRTPEYRNQLGDWAVKTVGRSLFYEQLVTFAGSTMNVDLNIPFAFQLNRVEQVFNDATARDFEIQIFSDPSVNAYASLLNQVTNTATSVISQRGDEYRYPSGSKIRLYYANFTAGKTSRVKIQVNEL